MRLSAGRFGVVAVAEFRYFKNNDPPKLMELWNRSRTGRGFGQIVRYDQLEQAIFCKPYFDRQGFIVAEDAGKMVGFCHCGLGCDATQSQIDTNTGTLCMVMVHPDFRRRGIGSDLLFRAQEYFKSVGVSDQYAGAMYPLNPFYHGLYGGSELPGVLESDHDATRFFMRRGYMPVAHCLIMQKSLDVVPDLKDTRLILLRRKVEVSVESWPTPSTWWQACTMNYQPALRYEISDKTTKDVIGRAWVWDMEAFTRSTSFPTVGITEFFIEERFRFQGYGKLLLNAILKHLKGQSISVVEAQVMDGNQSGVNLYKNQSFERVDMGHIFKLKMPRFPAPANFS